MGFSGIGEYANLMTHYFAGWLLLALFLFGLLILLFDTFIGFDMMVKRKTTSYDKYFFILLLALVPFIFQAMLYNHSEDRYLMNAFPSFFFAMSLGFTKIEGWLKKYSKYLGAFVILVLLAIGGYQQIAYGNAIISGKATSYQQVKDAGLWMKANSNSSAIILTRSSPQTTYYAEREVLSIPDNETDFEKLVQDVHPTFLELSVFETHPSWIYSYPQNHTSILIPVQGYQLQGQTVLAIYRFNNT
jgi:hypothetical protein